MIEMVHLVFLDVVSPLYIGIYFVLGLPEEFKNAKNPFPWMSEVLDLKKEKNFFETRVTEYQTGGALSW